MAWPRKTPPSRPRGQFGLRMLMMLMLVVAVMAAVFGGLQRGGVGRPTYVVLGIAAPVGVMLLLSLWLRLRSFWRNSR